MVYVSLPATSTFRISAWVRRRTCLYLAQSEDTQRTRPIPPWSLYKRCDHQARQSHHHSYQGNAPGVPVPVKRILKKTYLNLAELGSNIIQADKPLLSRMKVNVYVYFICARKLRQKKIPQNWRPTNFKMQQLQNTIFLDGFIYLRDKFCAFSLSKLNCPH